MSNDFYSHDDGVPGDLTRGDSSVIRDEFDLVAQGFGKLPTTAQVWSGSANYGVAAGAADAWTLTLAALFLTSYVDGMQLRVEFPAANTTSAPTLNLNGMGAIVIGGDAGAPINLGDIVAGAVRNLTYNTSTGKFSLFLGNSVASAQASAVIATTQAGIAAAEAGIATTQAGIATTQAAAASTSATSAAGSANAALGYSNTATSASATAGAYPNAAAANVPRGLTQASVGAITAGSGGTNGTFALAWSAGNFSINPTGTFTVAGGVLTAVTITGPGLYIGSSATVPTPSFAASSGLSGAGVALTAQFLVTSGQGYWVLSADGSQLDHYKNVSGVATQDASVSSIPAVYSLNNSRILAGTFGDSISTDSTGATGFNASTTGNSNFWSPMLLGAMRDEWLTSITVQVSVAGSGQILIVDAGLNVLSDTSVTVAAAGVNTIATFSPIFVPAGARVYFRTLTTILNITAGAGGEVNSLSIASSNYSGVVGSALVEPTNNLNHVSIQLSFNYAATPVEQQANAALALANGAQAALQYTRSSGAPTATFAVSSPAIMRWESAYDAGQDIPIGATVSGIVMDLIAQTGADHFRIVIAQRAVQTDAQAQLATGVITATILQVLYRTPAQLGLTLDASATQQVTIPIRPIQIVAGDCYHILVECRTALRAGIAFGLGYTTSSETRQRRRGWYSPSISGGMLTVPTPNTSCTAFVYYWSQAASSVFDTIVAASASVAVMNVGVTATLSRNGVQSTLTTSQAITPATGSNIRYDVIYWDQDAGAFGVAVGTERATDPSEFIPSLSNPKYLALFNTRATATAVTVVPVWNVFDGEIRDLEVELERERKRGRLCLQRTIGKIRRGAAVKVLSFGDSIVAIQDLDAISSTTPDGIARDRTYYYLEKIGSDLVGTYPLYTAVQLGRADDGAGAVHLKLGFVWELVNAMGKSGSAVTYNNFGVGGTSTSNAVDVSLNPAGWLTAAIALAPDVVVINFGMNEQGSTSTEANMVAIANYFIAAGIEVVIMGCVRKNVPTLSAFEYTNRALRRAAIYTKSAFLPMLPLYDARYIGAIGCDVADAAAANRNVHPGIREHLAIGKELTKLFMSAA